jgi:molybdate transport system substrate-binding protein
MRAFLKRNLLLAASIGFSGILLAPSLSSAAEIKVTSASGFRVVMRDLGPQFERAHGHKLVSSYATMGPTLKKVQEGVAADIVILPKPAVDTLVKDGKVVAASVTPVARSLLYLATAKGVPAPDIASPDAFKRALLGAKSITYADPKGGSAAGPQFAKIIDQLGITKDVQSKVVLLRATKDMEKAVAAGKVEVVLHQHANLKMIKGIDIVGPLPESLQSPVVFTAVIPNNAKEMGAAKALIDFLRSPESAKVIKAKGMEPA